SLMSRLFYYCFVHPPSLHSFPTRRSSDLDNPAFKYRTVTVDYLRPVDAQEWFVREVVIFRTVADQGHVNAGRGHVGIPGHHIFADTVTAGFKAAERVVAVPIGLGTVKLNTRCIFQPDNPAFKYRTVTVDYLRPVDAQEWFVLKVLFRNVRRT